MQSPTWVRARQLNQWAESPQAKVLLPELIARLVIATVPRGQLLKCDFAAEAETHRPGFDGITVSSQSTHNVPSGVSYWELGCDKQPHNKAQEDYEKRLNEHEERVKLGEADNIGQATFIAVTACDWHSGKKSTKKSKSSPTKEKKRTVGMEEWAEARSKENRFKVVEAYDSSRLEQWIREAPAVGLWLAKEMGKSINGAWDIESHWLDIQAALKKPLPPEVLLVNRDAIKISFQNWIDGAGAELAIRAPSALEGVAVFAAWVHTLPEKDADAISSRTIVVEDRETWRSLAESIHPLILVAAPRLEADLELYSRAIRKGHLVLRHADARSNEHSGAIELERMRRFDLEQALIKSGLCNESEAKQIAHGAGGNFTIMRRVFAKAAEIQYPAWSEDSVLATLLLAGAWEDERPSDKEVIQRITGLAYKDACATANRWRVVDDPPIRLVLKEHSEEKSWEFLSPLDAWQCLNARLTKETVSTFAEAAVEVLTEDNPALSLPPNDRPMASIKGKVWKYSRDLRQGIAEMLAIGATRQDESGLAKGLGFTRQASSIVRRILSPACGWQRWASLGQLLSSLVEAAPEEFLDAVERDLGSDSPQLVELMRQEIPASGLGGVAYHSGLLWSLETAAWPSEYLQRVSLILAHLATLDPGGTWANRPLASVTRLFFSWRPQTVASVGERIAVLKLLCQETPISAWKIVCGLMPDIHGVCFDNSKPSYRDWAAGWTGQVNNTDYIQFLEALADVAIELAMMDLARWDELLEQIANLYLVSQAAYERVRNKFSTTITDGIPEAIKEKLWIRVRNIVDQHTQFQDTNWALPPDELTKFALLRDRLVPDDAVTKLAYLFNDDGLMDADETLTYDQKRERRAEQRKAAIRDIWNAEGLSGILRLANKVSQPFAVGVSLAQERGESCEQDIIPQFLASGDNALDNMGRGFAALRISVIEVEKAESIPKSNWSIEQIANWAHYFKFDTRTWNWVASKGEQVERLYWTLIGAWGGVDLSLEDAKRAVRQYQAVNRAWSALEFLMSRQHTKKDANAEMLCQALEAVLKTPPEHPMGTMGSHYVREALSILQKAETNADENRVARIEYGFLPLLSPHFLLPKTLQGQLARDPVFFVDCLKLLYRARKEEGAGEESKEIEPPSEEARARAQRLWQLIHDWQIIPGSDNTGIVVPEQIQAWVEKARTMAKTVYRLTVCDITLGGVFAKSQPDADGAVPLMAIRDVIEKCKSEEILRGFSTGLHNLRGTYSKGLYEGGDQERKLAQTFEEYAKKCSRWPKTAKTLRSVAKDYLRQAEREDERAKTRD